MPPTMSLTSSRSNREMYCGVRPLKRGLSKPQIFASSTQLGFTPAITNENSALSFWKTARIVCQKKSASLPSRQCWEGEVS